MLDWAFDKFISSFIGIPKRLPDECIYVPASHDHCTRMPRSSIPEKSGDCTRIVVVSDTHGLHQFIGVLPEGDVFVHCGDILMIGRFFSLKNQELKLRQFNDWLSTIPCQHKIVVAGNHDHLLERLDAKDAAALLSNSIYLLNSECTVNGIRFWGSPISGLKKNSHNRAFQRRHFKTTTHSQVPVGPVEVLLTHGHCDELRRLVDHKVHLWGHSHHSHGVYFPSQQIFHSILDRISICAALPGRSFVLESLPIVLDIQKPLHSVETNYALNNIETSINNTSKIKMNESDLQERSSHSGVIIASTSESTLPVGFREHNRFANLKAFWCGSYRKIAPIPNMHGDRKFNIVGYHS